MLLLFTLVEFLAVAAVVVAAAKLDDSPSNVVESLSSPPILPIKHERQRDAMLQALNSVGVDDKKFEAFTSPEEQRSQYYIHEGFKSALHRAMRMANFHPETVWDPIVDVDSNNSDSSDDVEVEQWELAYSYFMEETLADMISDVEKSLQELTATNNNNNNEGAGDDEGQQTTTENNGEASNSAQDDKVKEEDVDAKELYYSVFDKIHNDYHCEAYNNVTLDDPRGMWMNITKLYRTFFDIDIEDDADTTLNHRSSLYDYKTEGNVYFDFIIDEKRNVQAPYRPKQSTLRGVFAARDFEQDELVYSYMANSLFFHELSTFERFIRFVSTSLSEYDACLLADWSFAQKLTRPGRYYICSALDEGVYLNQGSKYKANVYMDDTRDLRYYAKGKIVKGEEIICLD